MINVTPYGGGGFFAADAPCHGLLYVEATFEVGTNGVVDFTIA